MGGKSGRAGAWAKGVLSVALSVSMVFGGVPLAAYAEAAEEVAQVNSVDAGGGKKSEQANAGGEGATTESQAQPQAQPSEAGNSAENSADPAGQVAAYTWAIDEAGLLTVAPAEGQDGALPSNADSARDFYPWAARANDVKSIKVEDGVRAQGSIAYLFANMPNLESVDLAGLNTSDATDTTGLFEGSGPLATFDVGTSYDLSKADAIPASEAADGRWWSTTSKAWFAADQLAAERNGVADMYTSEGEATSDAQDATQQSDQATGQGQEQAQDRDAEASGSGTNAAENGNLEQPISALTESVPVVMQSSDGEWYEDYYWWVRTELLVDNSAYISKTLYRKDYTGSAEVTNVQVQSSEPEEAGKTVLEVSKDDEYGYWVCTARNVGTATVRVTCNVDGTQKTRDLTMAVMRERYSLHVDRTSYDTPDVLIPGNEYGMRATVWHEGENHENDAWLNGLTVNWTLEGPGAQYLTVSPTTSEIQTEQGEYESTSSALTTVTATQTGGAYCAQATVVAHVMKGGVELATDEYEVTASNKYYTVHLDGFDPKAHIGQQQTVTPQLRAYDSYDVSGQYETIPNVTFDLTPEDTTIIATKNADGSFTLNHENNGRSGFNVQATWANGQNSVTQWFYFDALDADPRILDENDQPFDDSRNIVFSNETRTLHLDFSNTMQHVEDFANTCSITYEASCWDDDTSEYRELGPADGVEFNVQTNTITLDGAKLYAKGVKYSYINATVTRTSPLSGKTYSVAYAYTSFPVAQFQETYDKMGDQTVLLGDSCWVSPQMDVYCVNKDHPNGEYVYCDVTNVEATSGADLVKIEGSADSGWNIYARKAGDATIKVTYNTIAGTPDSYTFTFHSVTEKCFVEVEYVDGHHTGYFPGSQVQLRAKATREYIDDEGVRLTEELGDGYSCEWSLESWDEDYATLTTGQDSSYATVTLRQKSDEDYGSYDAWIYPTVVLYRGTGEGRQEVARNKDHDGIHATEQYSEFTLACEDFDPNLPVGQSITVRPTVTRYSTEAPNGTDITSEVTNLRLDWFGTTSAYTCVDNNDGSYAITRTYDQPFNVECYVSWEERVNEWYTRTEYASVNLDFNEYKFGAHFNPDAGTVFEDGDLTLSLVAYGDLNLDEYTIAYSAHLNDGTEVDTDCYTAASDAHQVVLHGDKLYEKYAFNSIRVCATLSKDGEEPVEAESQEFYVRSTYTGYQGADSTRDLLPTDSVTINGGEGAYEPLYMMNTAHPDGVYVYYTVTGVAIVGEDGNPMQSSDVVGVSQGTDSEGAPLWTITAHQTGQAYVKVSYTTVADDEHGVIPEQGSYTFPVYVLDVLFTCAVSPKDGNTTGTPGSSIELDANVSLRIYNSETNEVVDTSDGVEVQWEIDQDSEHQHASLSSTSGSSTTVTFGPTSGTEQEWVRVLATATYGENETTWGDVWLSVDPDTTVAQLATHGDISGADVGDTFEVTPEVRHYHYENLSGDLVQSTADWSYDSNDFELVSSYDNYEGATTYTFRRLTAQSADLECTISWDGGEEVHKLHFDGRKYQADLRSTADAVYSGGTLDVYLASDSDVNLAWHNVEFCVGTYDEEAGEWTRRLDKDTHYRVSDDGTTVTLVGDALKDEGLSSVDVGAIITNNGCELARTPIRSFDVRTARVDYGLEQLDMLVGEVDSDTLTAEPGRYSYNVCDSDYPDGSDFDITITDAYVADASGNRLEDSDVISVTKGANSDGTWWDVKALAKGTAIVKVEFQSVDAEAPIAEGSFSLTAAVKDDVYELYAWAASGSMMSLPNGSIDLEADGWHRYIDEDDEFARDQTDLSYGWSIVDQPYDGFATLSSAEGKTTRVTFGDLPQNRNAADVKVRVELRKDGEYVGMYRYLDLYVRSNYTELWLTTPEGVDASNTEMGDSVQVTPELRSYSTDHANDEGYVLIADANVYYDICNGLQVTGPDENGAYTVTRTSADEIEQHWVAEWNDHDEDLAVDAWLWMGGKDYETDFESDRDCVYDDGNLALTLSPHDEDLDLGKLDVAYYVGTFVGGGYDDESDNWRDLLAAGTDYTVDEKTQTITLIGSRLAQTNRESVDVGAVISHNGYVLAKVPIRTIDIREASLEYDEGDRAMVVGERAYLSGRTNEYSYHVEDTAHPYGEDVKYTITDVYLVDELGIGLNDSGVVSITQAFDHGAPQWTIEAHANGSATVKVEYEEELRDGEQSPVTGSYTFAVTVADDAYEFDAWSKNNVYMTLHNSSVELAAEGWHRYRAGGENKRDQEGLSYEWSIVEEDRVEGPTLDGAYTSEPTLNVGVLVEDAERGGVRVRAELKYNGTTVETREFGIAVTNEYTRLVLVTGDTFDEGIDVGKTFTVRPELRRYATSNQADEHYEVVPDVDYKWHYDENALSIEGPDQDGSCTVTRLAGYGIELWCDAMWTEEQNDERHTDAVLSLAPKDYDVWFESDRTACKEDGSGPEDHAVLFDDEDLVLTLDASKLSGVNGCQIGLSAGYPAGTIQEPALADLPQSAYEIDGNAITLKGSVIAGLEAKDNQGNPIDIGTVVVHAEAKYEGKVFAGCFEEVEVRHSCGDDNHQWSVVNHVTGDDPNELYYVEACDVCHKSRFGRVVNLGNATVAFADGIVYDGTAQTPEPTSVKVGDVELVKGKDYTIGDYANNVNATTASSKASVKLTATEDGKCQGELTAEFDIRPAQVTDLDAIEPQTYTGAEIKPAVTGVKAGSLNLTADDYTVVYTNNTNAGVATATVMGKGNFAGAASRGFTILPLAIAATDVAGIAEEASYTGSRIVMPVVVTVDGKQLSPRSLADPTIGDYTVVYEDNLNAGTATVTVTGCNNYTGIVTKTFAIKQVNLADASVAVSGVTDKEYTGSAVTQASLALKLGDYTLVEGTDYTLSYENNVELGDTATVTAKGKGNFLGQKTTGFSIVPANVERATVSPINDCTYTGGEHKPKPVVTLDGRVLTEGDDYTLSYKNNVNAGTATVTVTGRGNYTGTKDATFRIVARTFPDVPADAWYAGVVSRAAGLGLISGYGDGRFGPEDKITRGQVAVVLWNMAGHPEPGAGARNFPDVKSGDYFYQAVRWASSAGVVSGYGDGRFGPNDDVTREQLAALIASYARNVAYMPVEGSAADYASMSDAASVSPWAVTSVGWCFRNRILSGSGGNVMPQGNATRAQAAKMVVMLYDLVS